MEQLDLNGAPVARVFDGERFRMTELAAPSSVDLSAGAVRVGRVCVRFVTLTELKSGHQLAERPEFGILFGRLRDRISILRSLYGPGPLQVDFLAMGTRAAAVRLIRCKLQRTEVDRLSSKTGQRHPLGGFVGEAEYQGELGEFCLTCDWQSG
ncbi:MAG: hypothetical protein WD696_19265 [Bryobacteraceae bacterium]